MKVKELLEKTFGLTKVKFFSYNAEKREYDTTTPIMSCVQWQTNGLYDDREVKSIDVYSCPGIMQIEI